MSDRPRRRRATRFRIAASLALASAALVIVPAAPAFADATITSAGPLTSIKITSDLNCAVNHASDALPEFYNSTACGTLIAVAGTLYGPANIPAGSSAAPRTAFLPVSQSAVTGTGSSGDPFTVVTVVDLSSSGLRLTETDSYVVGQESYRTDVELTNVGASGVNATIYRAGDCFLQNSDNGYGMVGSPTGAVACTTLPPPNTGGRIEQWLPITGGGHYLEANFNEVWTAIGTQQPFPDTCRCAELVDNGAGLSWTVNVPAGGSTTASSLITFSPSGVVPLSTTKTADVATAPANSSDGYTITVTNPNAQPVTLTSINDALPTGFSYVAGSTTGVTTADPSVVGNQLTWSGPFAVPGTGSVSLHFDVVVASTAGTYVNNAGADAGSVSVAPTGDTAPILVTDVPAGADVSVRKSDSPDPARRGRRLTYTVSVSNQGPSTATSAELEDTLAWSMRVLSVSPSQGNCATAGRVVTCALGSLADGVSATVTIAVRPRRCGFKTNVAVVAAAETDPMQGNNTATARTRVIGCDDDDDD